MTVRTTRATPSLFPATDPMTRHLVTSALFAGLAAGLLAALLQFWLVIPLLLEGELYESGVRAHFAASLSAPVQSPAGPAFGLTQDISRHLLTAGFNVVAFTGFALILMAFMAFAERAGHVLTPRAGIIWGLSGFYVMQFGPAIGLPPELPGAIAAEVSPRQVWWITATIASGLGLALIAFSHRPALWVIGLIALILPHIFGAPHLDTYFGVAPPELSALFVTHSLAAAAGAWATLGFLAAYFWTRANRA